MKTTVIAALALIASSASMATPPPFDDDSLRALWSGTAAPPQAPTCSRFVIVDTAVSFQVSSLLTFPPGTPPIIFVTQGGNTPLAGPFATAADAEDWLIELFIRINDLDATLDDVPVGPSGQRDCAGWNTLLVQQQQ